MNIRLPPTCQGFEKGKDARSRKAKYEKKNKLVKYDGSHALSPSEEARNFRHFDPRHGREFVFLFKNTGHNSRIRYGRYA